MRKLITVFVLLATLGGSLPAQAMMSEDDAVQEIRQVDPKLIQQLPLGFLIALLATNPAARGAASAAVAEFVNDGYKFTDPKCKVWFANDGFIGLYWKFVAAKKAGANLSGSCEDIKNVGKELDEVISRTILQLGSHLVKCACEAARL